MIYNSLIISLLPIHIIEILLLQSVTVGLHTCEVLSKIIFNTTNIMNNEM